MQDKPKFIRKNGRVIPIGGKGKPGQNNKKPKQRSKAQKRDNAIAESNASFFRKNDVKKSGKGSFAFGSGATLGAFAGTLGGMFGGRKGAAVGALAGLVAGGLGGRKKTRNKKEQKQFNKHSNREQKMAKMAKSLGASEDSLHDSQAVKAGRRLAFGSSV